MNSAVAPTIVIARIFNGIFFTNEDKMGDTISLNVAGKGS
jgi:hypothetical protein